MSAEVEPSLVRTEVKILGKTYLLRSEVDPGFATETAHMVNAKMRELIDKSGTVPTEKIAILTAMNLAGELLQVKRETTTLRETLRKKTKKVLGLIDRHI